MAVLSWRIDLSAPPRIIVLGTAVHGERQLTEQYHSNFWVLLFFHYRGEVVVDGQVLAVAPGMAGVFPPGATLTIRYRGRSHHRYAHLALPAGRPGKDRAIAACQDLGTAFAELDAQYERAIRLHAISPDRASSLLWDLLWRLAERTRPDEAVSDPATHPALAKAIELIELHLSSPLRIADLADEVGLSGRQLGNLFHAARGVSPVVYLRQRRMERARLLLTQTSTPITRIAADVGLPDLQAFNKIVRRALGHSPTAIRQRG